jgi:hypothetical protein
MTAHPLTALSGNLYNTGGICAGCADLDGDLSSNMLLRKSSVYPVLELLNTSNAQKWQFWDFDTSGDLKVSDNVLYPFSIEHATPSNTLYVAANGTVGIGTSTPSTYAGVQGLDIVRPNYPAVRLNPLGLTTVFDLYAATGAFGIFEEATGNAPFLLYTGAPQGSLVIAGSGKVGIGTASPASPLHVLVSGSTDPVLLVDGANATDGLSLKVRHPNGVVGFGIAGGAGQFFTTAAQHDAVIFGQPGKNLLLGVGGSEWLRITSTGKVGINMTAPTHFLDVGVSGAYCNGGAWVDGSSREYKQDIRELSGEDAAEAFASLNPVRFEYKAMPGEGHVGFIAEDVPDLVATPDRKGLSPMEVVAVLTKVVQDQKTLLEEQQKAIAELKQEVAQLKRGR